MNFVRGGGRGRTNVEGSSLKISTKFVRTDLGYNEVA